MEQISSITAEKSAYKVTFRKIARAAAAEARVHKKLAIIAYVLFGVAMLLFAINGRFYFLESNFEPSGWGAAFAVMGVLTSFFAALNVFRDTNNQQLCDVAMALPIKATERFFSKLLCLFYIQTAPLIVSVFGGNMLCVMIGSINGATPDSETFELIFAIFFALFAGSMFIMSITVLSACCCGAAAESAYFSIILGFIINCLPLFFVNNVLGNCAGFTTRSFWLFDSRGNIDVTYWGFLYLFHDSNNDVMAHAAIGSVISLAVMLISIFIYKKRDARTVGAPIASKVFFELIMAGGCATVFSIAVMNSDFGWGILLAGVAYVIINVIVCRAKINAFSFLKWIGKFALTTAVFMGIVAAAIKTGGFGYYKLRPDAKYFDQARFSIAISFPGPYYDLQLATDDLSPEQADEVMKICSKHIQKGIAHVNPFNIMFANTRNTTGITISANSDLEYWSKPPQSFHFYREWRTPGRYVYSLHYGQSIRINYAESQELLKELKQLDYVYNPATDDPR